MNGVPGGKRGRPVGRQMAWLALGADPMVVNDRDAHRHLRDVIGGEDYFLQRVDGRQELQDIADGGNAVAADILGPDGERPSAPTEGPEPAVAQ